MDNHTTIATITTTTTATITTTTTSPSVGLTFLRFGKIQMYATLPL